MVEYAIMAVAIAAVCVLIVYSIGGKVLANFTNLDSSIP